MNSGTDALLIKDKNALFSLIVAALFMAGLPMHVLSPFLIVLSGIGLGILIISLFALEDFRFLLNVYIIGFILRVFLSFLFYMFSFFLKAPERHGFLFANDGWLYSLQGWQICKFAERGIEIAKAEFLYNPNIEMWSGNITQYDYFTGFVYSITGYSPLSLFFISSLAGSIAALFIYLIAKELFSKKVARMSSLFAFFWPSFIIWSTQNLKEPMITMLACILIWTIFCMYRHYSPGFLLLSIVSVWGLFKIGLPYVAIIIGMFFFSGLFLFIRHLFKDTFIAVVVIIFLSVASVVFLKDRILLLASEKGLYDLSGYDSIFEFLDYNRSVRAYGRLQFFSNADISSFSKTIMFSPLGLLYAIFSPFPWQLDSVAQIMVVPETILFYILFPFTLKGAIFAYKKRFNQSILLLAIIGSIITILALVEGNSGTLFRHRSIVFYLLFIFTAIGLTLKNKITTVRM